MQAEEVSESSVNQGDEPAIRENSGISTVSLQGCMVSQGLLVKNLVCMHAYCTSISAGEWAWRPAGGAKACRAYDGSRH